MGLPMMLIEFPMMLRVDYWFTYGAASELYAYAASDLLPICTNVKMIYAHMLHVN